MKDPRTSICLLVLILACSFASTASARTRRGRHPNATTPRWHGHRPQRLKHLARQRKLHNRLRQRRAQRSLARPAASATLSPTVTAGTPSAAVSSRRGDALIEAGAFTALLVGAPEPGGLVGLGLRELNVPAARVNRVIMGGLAAGTLLVGTGLVANGVEAWRARHRQAAASVTSRPE